MSSDPREAIALLRYRIVAAASDPRLTPAERGQLVRELAGQAFDHPDGSRYTYSRGTLDRWVRAYREQGLDGLRPPPRADLGTVRRHPELGLLELAPRLRRRGSPFVLRLPAALEHDASLVRTGLSAVRAYGWSELSSAAGGHAWCLDAYLPLEVSQSCSGMPTGLTQTLVPAASPTRFPSCCAWSMSRGRSRPTINWRRSPLPPSTCSSTPTRRHSAPVARCCGRW